VNHKVYDVTKFLKLHPGGKKILLGVGGQECTEQFNQFHNASVMAKYGPKFIIGEVAGAAPKSEKKKEAAAPKKAASAAAPQQSQALSIVNEPFGEQVRPHA
jgi:cytochrome b involved in lipid metabolism